MIKLSYARVSQDMMDWLKEDKDEMWSFFKILC